MCCFSPRTSRDTGRECVSRPVRQIVAAYSFGGPDKPAGHKVIVPWKPFILCYLALQPDLDFPPRTRFTHITGFVSQGFSTMSTSEGASDGPGTMARDLVREIAKDRGYLGEDQLAAIGAINPDLRREVEEALLRKDEMIGSAVLTYV